MNIRNDNGTAVLTVQISNQNVDQSFQTEEFGVYAKIENDVSEVLYSYTTAVSADTFPNNRLGKTYESIQDIYMAISSDVEVEIYVRDGVIYLTRDIANQVYTETGITAVGTLKGRSNLEENKQYLADNGHWYKNIGGNRSWNSLGTPDEQLIPITWEYLYKSLNTKEGQLIQNLNGLLGKNNGQFPVDQAVEGNVYYFPANQKYYYCLKSQSGRTSVPNADFEEMSIWANKKKLENLIKVKRSGDCNIVHNDCTIAFEPWSSTLLKNRPNNENNPAGILISFYHGRRVQLYISGNTMYTRVNQGAEDYNSWLQWVKCSN